VDEEGIIMPKWARAGEAKARTSENIIRQKRILTSENEIFLLAAR
jgi:hypothetical protein